MGNFTKSLLLFSTLMLALPCTAETMPLGYCSGTASPTENYSSMDADKWSSGAIYIPASTAATIAGCKITSIRFGIGFMINIDGAKAWIRTSLDGDDLVSKSVDTDSDPKLASGWNEAVFDEPWVVPENCEGFYLGYSVHQKGWSYGLASNSEPRDNALFINLAEEGWKDESEAGTLFLQAKVEGDNLPGVNLAVGSCDLPDQFYQSKASFEGAVSVNNLGAKPAKSFDIMLLSDGKEVASTTVEANLEPGEIERYQFELQPDFPIAGQYDVILRIANISNGEDVDPLDNDYVGKLNVMENALERVVLVEEFSTERCKNCPSAAQTLHAIIERPENKGRIAPVVHHAGFYTDSFTQSWDNSYTWFYGNGGTYAPAFMVDRYTTNTTTPVMQVGSLDSSIKNRLATQPSLALDIQAGFDETDSSKIIVKVSGKNYSSSPVCESPYITLWLTEDNVPAISQSGASGGYMHQHLARAINSTWGEPLSFDGDTFEYTYTFNNVNADWKTADLAIVGAVHNVKGSDRCALKVANACYADYSSWKPMTPSSGVGGIMTGDDTAEAEYYTLSGLRVNPDKLAPGVYIRRCCAKSEKILIKRH